MRQRRHSHCLVWTVLVASLAFGRGAFAEEVIVSLDASGEYDSNIQGTSSRETDSFVTHIGPEIVVRDPYGRLTYEGRYTGDFTWYAKQKNFEAYDQYFDADVGYALSRQTTISVSESFRDLSNIRFEQTDVTNLVDTLDGGRDKFIRNIFGASLEHMFSRRISGELSLSNEQLDYQNDHSHTDSTFMGARGSLSYALARQDIVGVGAGFTYQKFEAAGNSLASHGQIWDSFLTWVHKFDSDMNLTVQAGPSFVKTIGASQIRTEQRGIVSVAIGMPPVPIRSIRVGDSGGACLTPSAIPGAFIETSCDLVPQVPPGSSPRTNIPLFGASATQTDVTFFGNASLTKNWEDWKFSVAYTRQQSGASGDTGTSALDRALISASYDADRLWTLFASVGWSRRERIGKPTDIESFIVTVPGPGLPTERIGADTVLGSNRGTSTNQYSVVLGTKRRLTKHLSADATFRYRHQINEGSFEAQGLLVQSGRNAEFFVFGVSLSYVFDPIRF